MTEETKSQNKEEKKEVPKVEETIEKKKEPKKEKKETSNTNSNDIIIDATNASLGRLASYCAKQALQGKSIRVVNCNSCVILGQPKSIIANYQRKRKRGGSSLKGPFFPKMPQEVVKRTIRSMLPDHRVGRGRVAHQKILCYNLVPPEFESAKKIVAGKPKRSKTITLKELSQYI